jgi:sialate O-acetylesterase
MNGGKSHRSRSPSTPMGVGRVDRPSGRWALPQVLGTGLALMVAGVGYAEVKLASLFTDHAVLQRRVEVPVWGSADPGEQVTVQFREHVVTTDADVQGRWFVRLPAMETGPAADLLVTGSNELRRRDVVLGEVWLASGQSNMAYRVEELEAPEEEAIAEFPEIRQFTVKSHAAMAPVADVEGRWVKASPATVGKFSATAYFFARELQRVLGVPVGILNASAGGTQIESWMSAESLAGDPHFAVVAERWHDALRRYSQARAEYETKAARWKNATAEEHYAFARRDERMPTPPAGPGHRDTPSSLFNGMIHPLVPYALRGVIWDQGGANAARSAEYGALFRALISDWRVRWSEPELPFYFVQDANYRSPDSPGDYRVALRLAQASALTLPSTGMVVQHDIGESNNVHPRNKWEVGRRLALLARAKTYGEHVQFFGPVLRSAVRDHINVRLTFDVQSGALMSAAKTLGGFEIAGDDGKFSSASAKIDGLTVVLTASVLNPCAVRYAWGDDPRADLISESGMPAEPFVVELK